MKIFLLIAFVSNGGSYGTTETMRFEMPDMAHCESVKENFHEIYDADPAFRHVRISAQCIDMRSQ